MAIPARSAFDLRWGVNPSTPLYVDIQQNRVVFGSATKMRKTRPPFS
jgi:hypothetical protein